MKSLFIFVFCLLCGACYSQQVWTIDHCMNYAIQNSYSTLRAQRSVALARKNYTSAIGRHLPSLGASAGASAGFGRGIDPATNTYISTASFNNGYGVNSSIPIFNGLQLLNNTLSAKVSVARSQSELQKAQDDIALKVMALYIEVLYNQGLVELTHKRVETFATDLKRAQRKSELGTSSAADVAQFASSLASEELTLIQRSNNLNSSILSLKEVMNYPTSDTLILVNQVSSENFEPRKASDIFASAAAYLPAIDILRKTLKVAKYQLNMAKSNYYPSLSASGGISTSYYTMLSGAKTVAPHFSRQIMDNIGESVSVNLSIPIFQGMSARMAVQKAKIAYAQAQSDYHEQMRTLSIEIERAVMDLESASATVEGATKSADAATLAYRAAKGKYEQGMLGVIELQTSYNQLLLSQVELLTARLKFEVKNREVAYYNGEPLINTEN
ncbi:MAG: TolC family protein [Mucinivorans sp.]